MKRYSIIGLFVGLSMGLITACSQPDKALSKVFTSEEIITLDKIITYYDGFVYSETGSDGPIEEAYREYISIIRTNGNDLDACLPSFADRIQFYQTLDESVTAEIFDTSDPDDPYQAINLQGKYMKFINELAATNDFFKNYYTTVLAAGDIAPTNLSMMLLQEEGFDINLKEHRLVFIVTLMKFGESIGLG